MFIKKKIAALICTLIVGVVSATVASVAFAASATGSLTVYKVDSTTYSNYAEVHNSESSFYPNDVVAQGNLSVSGNSNVPTGYIGVKTELYRAGTLCKVHDWYYNASEAGGLQTSSQDNCGAGNYTAKGQTAAYSFGEYVKYNILSSPAISGGSNTLAITMTSSSTLSASTNEVASSFSKNKNGETYGSAEKVAPNSEPDLIQAIGVDGIFGYVRAADLNTKMPKKPEEAISKQHSFAQESFREIKLYDVDGEKVIGTFHISQRPDDVKEFKK
ncbi:hypothetical protein [Paenibacillus sp. N3.4]|uniref:hypothetical protein n=1 Tax=Paenibacillus sp. N3.4 TaxID=2603222 RepID=UPI0011C84D7B|nr:hypothetical protein [Paenibacillus sp. N3.4]TXK72371.1 hypothetical protein FU659_31460 [Paenibacillus sp. N3.4]